MKLLIGVLLSLFIGTANAEALKVGSEFPKLDPKAASMQGVDGKEYTIESVRKPAGTLVIFSCNHCPYAVKWEERIAAIGNKYSKTWKDSKGKEFPGIGVIMINSNDPSDNPIDGMDEMKVRSKTLGLEFPYVVDATSKIARAYGASKTPEIFLFGPDGKLVYQGAVDDSYEISKMKETWLIDAIENMLKSQPIEPNYTKAIGCSIKFRS